MPMLLLRMRWEIPVMIFRGLRERGIGSMTIWRNLLSWLKSLTSSIGQELLNDISFSKLQEGRFPWRWEGRESNGHQCTKVTWMIIEQTLPIVRTEIEH